MTESDKINIDWLKLGTFKNGGNLPSTWNVACDFGSGSTDLNEWMVAGFLLSEKKFTQAVTEGTTYQFAVSACNIHGCGPYGNIISLLAAEVPD